MDVVMYLKLGIKHTLYVYIYIYKNMFSCVEVKVQAMYWVDVTLQVFFIIQLLRILQN